jgi:hypothetical protein
MAFAALTRSCHYPANRASRVVNTLFSTYDENLLTGKNKLSLFFSHFLQILNLNLKTLKLPGLALPTQECEIYYTKI